MKSLTLVQPKQGSLIQKVPVHYSRGKPSHLDSLKYEMQHGCVSPPINRRFHFVDTNNPVWGSKSFFHILQLNVLVTNFHSSGTIISVTMPFIWFLEAPFNNFCHSIKYINNSLLITLVSSKRLVINEQHQKESKRLPKAIKDLKRG